MNTGIPCGPCPWMKKGQPDITDKEREAAERGEWFCCHVNMGTCHGAGLVFKKAQQYAANPT